MYIDIDPNDNVDESVMATFKETGPSREILAVRLWRDESWQWCAVTGWDSDGPSPAFATAIEESGDGPALLIHGGNQGLRCAAIADQNSARVPWDVHSKQQWGEPFLLCRPDASLRLRQ